MNSSAPGSGHPFDETPPAERIRRLLAQSLAAFQHGGMQYAARMPSANAPPLPPVEPGTSAQQPAASARLSRSATEADPTVDTPAASRRRPAQRGPGERHIADVLSETGARTSASASESGTSGSRAVPPPAGTAPQPAAPNQELSTQSLDERAQQLQVLAGCVADCTRCEELAATRTQTVFGVGNPAADILFLGEAPGADEDRQGIPFVGRAGQLLDRIIAACHLQRDEIYICNILRCRPPGNRNPTPAEAGNCREWLDGQISTVDPEHIVCWGSVAAQNLLGVTTPIGRMRGRFYEYGRAKVLCTYHPSYLLRNPDAKQKVWADMKFLMRDRGVNLD